jgi:outer membrane protein TolC
MLKVVFTLIIISVSSSIKAQDTTYALVDVIAKALDKNHSIQVFKLQENLANNEVFIGNAGMLPKIDVVAGNSYSNQLSDIEFAGGLPPLTNAQAISSNINAGLRLQYTLFDGLGMFRTYDKLKLNADLAGIQTKINIESTIIQVISMYYQIFQLQKQLEIQKNITNISKDRLVRMELRMDYGSSNSIDVLNAKVDYYNDSSSLLSLNVNLSKLKRQLNFYLGNDIKKEFKVAESIENQKEFDKDKLYEDVMSNNSNLLLTQVQLDVAEVDKKIVQSRYLPRLALNADYGYAQSENNASVLLKSQSVGFTGGLSFTWNLFDGLKQKHALEKAAINIDISTEKKLEAQTKVEVEFLNAYEQFMMEVSVFKLMEQNVITAKLNLERSKSLFYNGQLNSIEFRQAQLNLQNAELKLVNAKINIKLQEFELLRLSNQLIK